MTKGLAVVLALAACAVVAAAGAKVRKLEPREVAEMQASGREVVFLDTRKGASSNKIPGSVHLPPDRVDAWAETADRKAVYVAYCT
jgi:hypothetical protein